MHVFTLSKPCSLGIRKWCSRNVVDGKKKRIKKIGFQKAISASKLFQMVLLTRTNWFFLEDDGLLDQLSITSSNYTYVLPLRATTVTKKYNLYKDEKAEVEEVLGRSIRVVLIGDNCTPISNHSYLIWGHSTLFSPTVGTLVTCFDW